jgi:hypothetical protein
MGLVREMVSNVKLWGNEPALLLRRRRAEESSGEVSAGAESEFEDGGGIFLSVKSPA